MRGKQPTIENNNKKQWKKSTSLYQRSTDRQISTGAQGLKFHGHIAPVTTGARPSKNLGKITNRLKTAGGTEENSNSGTILNR